MAWFQKVVAGTASYAAGGFDIAVPEVERIESATVFMTPETIIATTMLIGMVLSYQANTATVKLYNRTDESEPTVWTEIGNGSNLSGANFIITGKGI